MLKSLTLAVALIVSTAPASAGEVTDRCGPTLTWESVKCAASYASMKARFTRAEKYERRAQEAEQAGDANSARRWRNLANYERAEGERLDEVHRRRYPGK